MMIRPSVWSSYFIEFSPELMVETFAKQGWFESELSDEHGAALLERGDPAKEGARFRQFATDHGVTFPQGHLWLKSDIAALNQGEVIGVLKRWLDLFVAVGVREAVLHPGGKQMADAGRTEPEIHAARVRALRELCGHAAGGGCRICLENCIARTAKIEELLEILDAVAVPNLGICLDTGHLNITARNQGEFILKAGRHLTALHLADNEGAKDQHMMPFGKGTVPWPEVVRALREIGYQGLFNFEIPGERRAPLEVKLAKLDYLKRLVPLMTDGRLERA